MDAASLVIGIVLGAIVYLIPSFVAHGKRREHEIFVVNLLLGWTLVGWVGALVWAMMDSPKGVSAKGSGPAPTVALSASTPGLPQLCAHCGKYSYPGMAACEQCGKPFSSVAQGSSQ
jgi:hypothetical protein